MHLTYLCNKLHIRNSHLNYIDKDFKVYLINIYIEMGLKMKHLNPIRIIPKQWDYI